MFIDLEEMYFILEDIEDELCHKCKFTSEGTVLSLFNQTSNGKVFDEIRKQSNSLENALRERSSI